MPRVAFDPADFSPALQVRLLVLQPTPFCNIDCGYCYLPDRGNKARLAFDTLRTAMARLRDDGLLGEVLSVVWHAGEPMVLPPSWYDEALGVIDEALAGRCRVEHSMQTNATLVDERWCRWLRERRVALGVSVDGPARLHDRQRRTRGGRGTHARVCAGMARLREAGVPFHAIAVVTEATLADPDGFLDWFVAQGVCELACNFDEAEGEHAASSLAGHEARHAAFLARLAERCDADGAPVALRELEAARAAVLQALPRYRWRGAQWPDNAQVLPFAITSVAHDGGWSTFSPELIGQAAPMLGNFVFGNVLEAGFLEGAARSAAFQRCFAAVMRGVAACAAGCAHFAVCGGGAPANKHYELGTLAGTETLYCRSMIQRPFDVMLARLERQAAMLTRPLPPRSSSPRPAPAA